MLPVVQKGLIQALGDKQFGRCIDLGCGWGDAGKILRPHVNRLIGVDRSEEWLGNASSTEYYDERVLSDIRDYWSSADLVVCMDVIEHIPHSDGEQLLCRYLHIPNMIISTPFEFFPNPKSMPHLSLWADVELAQYGFSTRILVGWFQPLVIIGTRFA